MVLEIRGLGLGVCWVLASLVAGCEGESKSESEEDRQGQCPARACGGDVLGTWDVDSFCLAFAEPPAPSDDPECRDALRDYGADADGTLTFTADGMVTSSLTTTLRVEIAFTDACAQALAGVSVTQAMCDDLQANYRTNPEYESATCTFSPGACWCSIRGVPSTSAETNPYSLDGEQILMGTGKPSDYCVEGERLTIGVVVPDGSYSIDAHRL